MGPGLSTVRIPNNIIGFSAMLSIKAISPHVVQGQEPDLDLFIPYTKLNPYILPKAIVLKK